MSRKFVQREGTKWVEKGIVTKEQHEQILDLYEEKKHAVGILPILGSILVGLGILSFVAANWQEIPHLFRLVLILVTMFGFYLSGELFYRRGQDKLGIALIGLGLFTFGAGVFLVGQMFNLVATNVGSFIIWGSAGTILTYLYRSRYLYLVSLVIFNIAEWYSIDNFHQFSYAAFILMVIGLGIYGWIQRNGFQLWVFSMSVIIQSMMLVAGEEWKFVWFLIPVMIIYTLGDWVKEDKGMQPMQGAAATVAFVFGVFVVLFYNEFSFFRDTFMVEPIYFLAAAALIFAVSLYGKLLRQRGITAVEWLLFCPYFFVQEGADVLYLLALVIYSLYVLWRGYEEQWRFKINLGTSLFIGSAMLAYIKFTWGFMEKSMFFIVGGLILLGLSWYLNRRKREFFTKETGGTKDE